ncbi:MAG: glycosyltransferase [Cyanobacteria bacterium LVE1205-1]|jgi:glycosyltransferase involved in cell wall biosynthesis
METYFSGGDDDGTRDQLQKQFLKRHLLGNVFFLDACEPNELSAVYTAANLFILPSRHENFGNVLIESMACSCPVLISDKVGLHHEILQSGLGWVLPLHPGKWVSILETLMQNPIAVQNSAAKTRPWIMDKFTVERVASEMGELYQDVISTKGGKSLQD